VFNLLNKNQISDLKNQGDFLIEEYKEFYELFTIVAYLSFRINYYIEQMLKIINNTNENKLNDGSLEDINNYLKTYSHKLLDELKVNKKYLEKLNEIHSNFVNTLSNFLDFLKKTKIKNREDLNYVKLELLYYKSEFEKIIKKYKNVQENLRGFIDYLKKSLKE